VGGIVMRCALAGPDRVGLSAGAAAAAVLQPRPCLESKSSWKPGAGCAAAASVPVRQVRHLIQRVRCDEIRNVMALMFE
jgi:hypothetical protein